MRFAKWGVATGIILISSVAFAAKIDDFKAAVAEDGCKSIPYSDLRGRCATEGAPMHDWCDAKRGPVSCGAEGTTNKLRLAVETEKKLLESLKEKKRDLEGKRAQTSDAKAKAELGSELEKLDKEIYESGKTLEKAKDEVSKRRDLVKAATYNVRQCIAHREAVMAIFRKAQDRVSGEHDSKELKEIARQLRDKYQAETGVHSVEIKNREKGLAICDRESF